jgi:hypothetical protein
MIAIFTYKRNKRANNLTVTGKEFRAENNYSDTIFDIVWCELRVAAFTFMHGFGFTFAPHYSDNNHFNRRV